MLKFKLSELSDSGVSISTGVALDSILGNKLSNRYKIWYINIYTLVRNYINSLEGNVDDKISILKDRNKIKTLTDEMLNDFVTLFSQTPNDIEIFLYRPNYKTVEEKLNNYRKLDELKGMKYFIIKYSDTIIDRLIDVHEITVEKTKHKLPKIKSPALITTHIGLDLLSFSIHEDVLVIESNTGDMKKRDKWYTKLGKMPNKDMSIIPFMEYTYYIFGDTWMVKPLKIKDRITVYSIAIKNRWSFKTTKSKLVSDLRKDEPMIYSLLKFLPKLY